MSTTRWRWLIAVAYGLMLLTATHLPLDRRAAEQLERVEDGDKFLHIAAYAVLAFLVFGLCGVGRQPMTAAFVLVGLAGLAALDELTQPLTGRFADFGDWLADCGGLLGGYVAAVIWDRRSPVVRS